MREITEEERKKAFLDYQKTGVMNEIVAMEIADYEKSERRGLKLQVYTLVVVFVGLYFALYALWVWKYLQTHGLFWGIMSVIWTFLTVVDLYVIVKYRKKRK